jgi:hypothetical protein
MEPVNNYQYNVYNTQYGGNRCIAVQKTLYLREGVEWTIHHSPPFSPGVDRLIELKGKASTQRARFHIILTSAATGGILEGENNITFTPQSKQNVVKIIPRYQKPRSPPGLWKREQTDRRYEDSASNSSVEISISISSALSKKMEAQDPPSNQVDRTKTSTCLEFSKH